MRPDLQAAHAAKRERAVKAFEAGELSLNEIARQLRLDKATVRAAVYEAWANGRCTRDPTPPSTRATRTGRI